jgi:hypothetical protein
MTPNAVATHSGAAEWMGRGGFWSYVGGIITPLPCPISNDIFNDMDTTYGPFRTFAAHHGMYPEVWYFYPSTGKTECDTYIIHNYKEDWWAWGLMSRSAMSPAGAFRYPKLGSPAGEIYTHELGFLDDGSTRIGSVFAETNTVAAGEGDRTLEVNQAMLGSGHGYNSMALTIYSRMTPEGSERTFGPYSPRSDGYTDTRATGRDLRMRMSATQDAAWSIGKLRLDVQTGTGR